MLVTLLVMIIVIGLLLYLVRMLPIEEPFKTYAVVVVIVIAIIWLLSITGLLPRGLVMLGAVPLLA